MSKVTFPATSPYYATTQGTWYTGPMTWRDIPPDSSDSYITSLDKKYENRPDRLSQDLYGTIGYWWIFQVRNMDLIRDPIWDLTAGMALYVPTLDRLKTLIG